MPGSYHLGLIPLLPLLGAVANGLLGRSRSRRFVSTVGVGSVALSCAWAFLTFFRWYESNPTPYLEPAHDLDCGRRLPGGLFPLP